MSSTGEEASQDFSFQATPAAQENLEPNLQPLQPVLEKDAFMDDELTKTPQQDSKIKESIQSIITPAENVVKETQNDEMKKDSVLEDSTLPKTTKQEELVTPPPMLQEPVAPVLHDKKSDDFIGQLWSLLTWENKIKSGIIMAFGLGCFYGAGVWFYVYEKNLCSMICNSLLVLVGINLIGGMFTQKWNSQIGNVKHSVTAVTLSQLASNISSLTAELYDTFVNAPSPWTTLNVLLVLWALRSLGNITGMYSLSLFVFIGAFIVSPLYKEYQQVIQVQEGKLTQFFNSLQRQYQLSRAHMLAILAIFVALDWPFSNGETRLTMLLTIMVVFKCQLKPEEITMFEEKLTETLTPILQSVQRSMASIVEAAQEEGIIPTPQKVSPIGFPTGRILFSDSPDVSAKKTL
eukprot:TRINITY_DN9470_c0_g2_i1.p1 TRINITY_DN9470_c0_g2~~TRINITY_DN9470_c0_g2_i1.p1  ORF type:complete len:405 (+),score=49.70 TRINITY_DN9470_c0_g2_i1:149-1363(+)